MLIKKEILKKEKQLELYLSEIAPRLEEGKTQIEIAEELGYSKQQIHRAVTSSSQITNELVKQGIDPAQLHSGWVKVDGYSLYFQNKDSGVDSEIYERYITEAKKYAPKYKKIKRTKIKDGHLLVVDPSDIHIGKLAIESETGSDYNSKIAVERVHEAVDGILQKSSIVPIDKIVLVIGNDILNTDNINGTTTSGTKQDNECSIMQSFISSRKLYVDVIERLLTVADVHVVYNRSNHDAVVGFTLAEAIHCWFHNNKNVTFDTQFIDRKYFKYGQNMIVTSHGNNIKEQNLTQIIATEQPQMWADTKFRYAYLHHLHSYQKTVIKIGSDLVGLTIERLRSPSSADIWHSDKGYFSPLAIEGFIHAKDSGQIIKLTHYF